MTAEQPSSDLKQPIPTTWVEVWKAGMVIFGDKWEIKHGSRPSGEWANVFLSINEQQLKVGVDRMKSEAEQKIVGGIESWPPNPFEFACFCKTKSSLYFADEQKSLPPPRPSKEFANSKLKEMRKKLI